jgi:hypothetical protein
MTDRHQWNEWNDPPGMTVYPEDDESQGMETVVLGQFCSPQDPLVGPRVQVAYAWWIALGASVVVAASRANSAVVTAAVFVDIIILFVGGCAGWSVESLTVSTTIDAIFVITASYRWPPLTVGH